MSKLMQSILSDRKARSEEAATRKAADGAEAFAYWSS
jgi:hypothetical protein